MPEVFNLDKLSKQSLSLGKEIFDTPKDVFDIDEHLSTINKDENINVINIIGVEEYEKITKRVIDVLTNPKGTKEEKRQHNELLARCAKGNKLARKQVKSLIIKVLTEEKLVDPALVVNTAESIYRENYGLGPIQDLYDDPTISEIWVNGYDHIWIDKGGVKMRLNKRFKNDQDVERVIRLMLRYDKKNISPTNPRVECRMEDGSRLTVMIPPTAKRPYINIRKFSSFKISTENYLKSGTFNKEMANFLQKLIKGRANIIISGETNSGKTTLLKYLIQYIDPRYRIGVIESHFELKLDETYPDRNIVSFEVHEEDPINISMKDLFVSMLRYSPDIIIVGEARSTEAEEMIKAMRRGHQGSIGTIHSSSPELAIADIMDMINEDGKSRNAEMLLKKVTNAIDIIIQLRRFSDGSRRITRISEVWATPESELNFRYEIRDIYVWVVDYTHENNGYFKKVNSPSEQLKAKLFYYGLTEEEVNSL